MSRQLAAWQLAACRVGPPCQLQAASAFAMSPLVETSLSGAVALCRLNRPEARNALSPELMEELAGAVEGFDVDPEVRCIVIAGSEEVFAAGADIGALAERRFHEAMFHPAAAFWRRLAETRTPMVAAVSGWALGGGCELALVCDLIVASETAEFGQPEITLGIIPGGGGTQRLARAVGKQRAMELVLTGRRFDAREAERLGLVNLVVEKREWLDAALELATADRIAPAARLAARKAGGAGRRGDRALGRPRAGAATVRACDGHRGPGRGDAGVPREAAAELPRALSRGESLRSELRGRLRPRGLSGTARPTRSRGGVRAPRREPVRARAGLGGVPPALPPRQRGDADRPRRPAGPAHGGRRAPAGGGRGRRLPGRRGRDASDRQPRPRAGPDPDHQRDERARRRREAGIRKDERLRPPPGAAGEGFHDVYFRRDAVELWDGENPPPPPTGDT